jgi:trigger factor
MQVNELRNDELEKEFEVIVPASEVNSEVQKRLSDLAKKVSIPGFRVGKVPLSLVEGKYKNAIFAEIAEEKMKSSISSIVRDRNFDLLSTPDVTSLEANPGSDIKFSFKLEIIPKFELPKFAEMTLDRVAVLPSEKELQKMRDMMKKWRAKEVEIADKKHKSAEGDVVVIDFKGFQGDVPFEGGEAKEFKLELGCGSMIPGFEDQIMGKKIGDEFDIMVTFPEAYHSADLAGKEAKFEIKLHKILKKELPEWNEDYAKELKYESLAALEDFVKRSVISTHSESIALLTKIRLFNKIDEAVEFVLPSKMVEKELANLMSQLKKEGEVSEKEDDASYEKVAKRRVKIGLILAEYARAKNITVVEQDLQNAIMMQAREMGWDRSGFESLLKFYKGNQEAVVSLRDSILESKAVDYIIANEIKTNNIEISPEDLAILLDKEAEEALW